MKVIFEVETRFGMAGTQVAAADFLYYEGKTYTINMYPIDVKPDTFRDTLNAYIDDEEVE